MKNCALFVLNKVVRGALEKKMRSACTDTKIYRLKFLRIISTLKFIYYYNYPHIVQVTHIHTHAHHTHGSQLKNVSIFYFILLEIIRKNKFNFQAMYIHRAL
jgi:hypothetical protein